MKWLVLKSENHIPHMAEWFQCQDGFEVTVEKRVYEFNNATDVGLCLGLTDEDAVMFKLKYGNREGLYKAVTKHFEMVDLFD